MAIATWRSSLGCWQVSSSTKTAWGPVRSSVRANCSGCRRAPAFVTASSIPRRPNRCHLYQVWLLPERKNLTPEYEQREFPAAERAGRWQLVASHDGREGSLTIHQDAQVFWASLAAGESLDYPLARNRFGWLQVAHGALTLGAQNLLTGDGASIAEENPFRITAQEASEVLLFDLG